MWKASQIALDLILIRDKNSCYYKRCKIKGGIGSCQLNLIKIKVGKYYRIYKALIKQLVYIIFLPGNK